MVCVMCSKMVILFYALLLSVLTQDAALASDDDESEAEEPSKPVLHASLITLESIGNKCALKTTDMKYPLK